MIISLTGYMGSGKSTIGNKLAKILGYNFIDLDDYIISKEKKEIKDIFSEHGEIFFRKIENIYLQEILSSDNLVLSLGGGTPVYHDNIDIINKNSISFYLRMSPAKLAKRLMPQKEHRPLISHLQDNELTEFIAKHLFDRSPFYEKTKFKINNNFLTEDQACKEILTILNSL